MTYPRSSYSGRRALAAPMRTPSGPGAQRKAWLPVTAAALRSAAAPDEVEPVKELAAAIRGLSADSFPLALGDARREVVKAFVALVRFWVVVTPVSRTAFAPAMLGLAGPLDRLLHDLGADMARAADARRGFRGDD